MTALAQNNRSNQILAVAMGLLVVATVLFGATVVAAFEPGDPDHSITPISHSAEIDDAKLVWLPYRPSAAELRAARARRSSKVARAEFQSPATAVGAAGNDPMSDPFGDRIAQADTTPAAEDKPFQPEFIDPVALPGADSSGVPKSNRSPSTLRKGVGDPADKLREPDLEWSLNKDVAANSERDPACLPADFKPIGELTIDIKPKGDPIPGVCGVKEETFVPRVWEPTTFTWKASGLCHKPLYFEEVQLERYGHSFGPYLQPVISQGHFFATVPVLPYLMGVNPPNECLYTLGYYRPGSCAPYMLDPLPISVRGALLEAGFWTGGAYLLP
ncbi:MAG: hypothetical protein JW888_07675 [Pirellulales bacterium]|nr:hypothetical protein [Pirellulales bacterium]